MSGNNIKFDDKKIKESDFYKNKKTFNINDIDINNILVSKKEKYGKYDSFQHFIGYNDNNGIKPLYLEFPQKFNENKDKKIKIFLKNTIKYGKKLKN